MKRHGMALIITMVMITFITMSITMLYISSRDEMMIAGNARRAMMAQIAAESGVQHFDALDLTSVELHELAGSSDSLVIIPSTKLGDKLYYDVSVVFSQSAPTRFAIVSTGEYKRGDKIISKQVVEAHYETVDN